MFGRESARKEVGDLIEYLLRGNAIAVVQRDSLIGLFRRQVIWDEVGESDAVRDKILLELEQQCQEVYRRKVDQANRSRVQIRKAIADSEAQLAAICSAMGERPIHLKENVSSLREKIKTIVPQLEEMQKKKCERRNQFIEVLEQIQKISNEIFIPCNTSKIVVDEMDLSMKKLEDLHRQLEELQKEKSDHLKQVLDHINTLSSLCLVLGMDFNQTVREVHPTLDNSKRSMNISNETIEKLVTSIQRLRDVKMQRMQKLQDLAASMLELWNLMDMPIEEQQLYQNVTCNIAASEHEITEPGFLSLDFINYVVAEVSRLEELKASKMKELVLKKWSELEEICRQTRMVAEVDSGMEYAIEAMESGVADPSSILEQIEDRIAKVKEEAFSRKEILDKVEKWVHACEEECWLEDYNRDENRFSAGRGTHLVLKRAERARAVVNKLPAMVEALVSKTTTWERERGIEFMYDGVRLLSMLEEYCILRQEKELERRRQRDQKRLQGQLIAEQEALYGSKPSPSKPQCGKKIPRTSTGSANRRLSLGGAALESPKLDSHSTKSTHGLATLANVKENHSGQKRFMNHHQDDAFAVLLIGRRCLDVASHLGIRHPLTATNDREIEAATARKPLSPVSTITSKVDATKFPEDRLHSKASLKALKAVPTNNAALKRTEVTRGERIPKAMPIPGPTTPLTVSVPMQVATTPAAFSVPHGIKVAMVMSNDIEYSFEERRAGFVISQP